MDARRLVLLGMSSLVALVGCALWTPQQPAANHLVGGARCTIRVWDPGNPDDLSRRVDYWGTVASADDKKIELVEANTEPIAGKPLLDDPRQLPPAVWVRRMRERGANKYTIRRDQILSVDVLDPQRLQRILMSYPPGTRCNIRTCDSSDPHNAAGYRDLWGKVTRCRESAIELIEGRDEPAVISGEGASLRQLSDASREAHLKSAGSGDFKVAPERIIAIELLERRPEPPHAQSTGWVRETLF